MTDVFMVSSVNANLPAHCFLVFFTFCQFFNFFSVLWCCCLGDRKGSQGSPSSLKVLEFKAWKFKAFEIDGGP